MITKILDVGGEEIPNLIFSFDNQQFEKPFIINDIIKKKDKTPEIKIYEDLNILKEIQFIAYGKELNDDERWAKRQRYSIHLRPAELPVEKTFKKMLRLPPKHCVEVDIANSKVRLVGDFVDLREKGVWQEY
jgi:hypothetical protein